MPTRWVGFPGQLCPATALQFPKVGSAFSRCRAPRIHLQKRLKNDVGSSIFTARSTQPQCSTTISQKKTFLEVLYSILYTWCGIAYRMQPRARLLQACLYLQALAWREHSNPAHKDAMPSVVGIYGNAGAWSPKKSFYKSRVQGCKWQPTNFNHCMCDQKMNVELKLSRSLRYRKVFSNSSSLSPTCTKKWAMTLRPPKTPGLSKQSSHCLL